MDEWMKYTPVRALIVTFDGAYTSKMFKNDTYHSWERNFVKNFIQIVCKLKVDSIFDIFEDRSSKKDSLLYIHTYLLTSTYLVILYQVHLRLKVADDAVFFCRTHQTKI